MAVASRDMKPADDAEVVTPSDTVLLRGVSRGIYTGSGGDLAVKMVSGASVVFADTAAGSVLPIQVTHVLDTGTAATDIVALY